MGSSEGFSWAEWRRGVLDRRVEVAVREGRRRKGRWRRVYVLELGVGGGLVG